MRSSFMSLAVGGLLAWAGSACNITKLHDCKETPGYCAFNEYCDSDTRRCTLSCSLAPPRPCPAGSSCDYASGKCRPQCLVGKQAIETSCTNGLDDDCNGQTDCAETVCEGQVCGPNCLCKGGLRTETDCDNEKDDDFDGDIDCVDSDCADFICRMPKNGCEAPVQCDGITAECGVPKPAANAACGTGCVCTGVTPTETRCDDGTDNDVDGTIDCADVSDCPNGTACTRSGGGTGTCDAGACQ